MAHVPTRTTPITDTPAWRALTAHADTMRHRHLRDLFADDPGRAERLTVQAGSLRCDLSKHRVTAETLDLLVALAEQAGLAERTTALFQGAHVNTTEDRPALHPVLRAPRSESLVIDGQDVVAQVHDVLDRMEQVARQVRDGTWRGHTGQPMRAVVNIGIGGSDLGPQMAYRALAPYVQPGIEARFVSNVDPSHLLDALRDLDPATTLFVVSSKTFTTIETLTNARHARDWLVAGLDGDDAAVARHFLAVSSNLTETAAFGIASANVFEMWDWVGGRYSLDSAIGLSLMIAVGPARFREMLAGFREMDQHFRHADLSANGPALAGLLGVWYRNFLGFPTHAVLPYDQHLDRFPAYLQQLDMESNGKSVRLDGTPVVTDTGPVVWGEPGTNGQHAFYQLLHQGTTVVPADLIGFVSPAAGDLGRSHDLLIANLLAQAEALAFGKTPEEVAADRAPPDLVPHRSFPGNRPTAVILAPVLTPHVLGELVAFYEHKVFTQGVVWGVDSFDQWGVELGKVLARDIFDILVAVDEPAADRDPSTNALIAHYRSARRQQEGEGS